MFAQALMVLTYLIAARSMDPSQFGRAASFLAGAFVLSSILTFGTNSHAVREFSSARITLARLLGLSVSRMGYALGASVVFGAVGALVLSPGYRNIAIVTAVVIITNQAYQVISTVLFALSSFKAGSVMLVLDRLIGILGIIVWAEVSPTPVMLPAVIALGGAVGCGSASIYITIRASRAAVRFKDVVTDIPLNPWRGTLGIGATNTAFSLQQLDIPILQAVSSAADAGHYSAVARWTQPFALLATAVSRVRLPGWSSAASGEAARDLLLRERFLGLSILGIGFLGALLSPLLVAILLGASYASSAGVLAILFVSGSVAFCNQILYNFCVARSKEGLVVRLLPWAILLQFVVLVSLAPSLGATAAAVANVTMQIVSFIMFASVVRVAVRSSG